jgi:superfamily II DNA or RNA helicase
MKSATIIIQDEVNAKISNLDLDMRKDLVKKYKLYDPAARYTTAYKLGRWDGAVSFFGIGGTTYVSLLETVIEDLINSGYEINIDDQRQPLDLVFETIKEDYWGEQCWPAGHRFENQPIRLREDQVDAANRFLSNPQSIQELATGFGKTILTATLCHACEKYGRTLIIVPNRSLVEQTYEDFNNVGLDTGVYFGTKKELGRTHTICTWQSLNILSKKGKSLDEENEVGTIKEFLKDVNTVIVDETHVAQAQVLKSLLTNHLAHAPIRWGFTGTIPKDQISQWSIRASIGEIVGQVKASDLQEAGILSDCFINVMQTVEWKEFAKFPQELDYLVTDQERMKFVSKFIKKISLNGNTLVLVDRIKCGKLLQEYLSELTNSEVPFVSGSVKTDDRKEEYQEIGQSDHGLLVATYGVASVGINIVRLHNVVMIEPGKSFVRVIQSIGRGLRKGNDKDFVNIYDICATTKYSKKHLTERKRYYKDAKYSFSVDKVKRPTIG